MTKMHIACETSPGLDRSAFVSGQSLLCTEVRHVFLSCFTHNCSHRAHTSQRVVSSYLSSVNTSFDCGLYTSSGTCVASSRG